MTDDNTTPSSGQTPTWPAGLSQKWRDYLTDRANLDWVVAARGSRDVLAGKASLGGEYAAAWGFPKDASGMLMPLHPLSGGEAYQLRLDDPEGYRFKKKWKKARKFLTPTGQKNALYTSPAYPVDFTSSGLCIAITEGITRIDALAPWRLEALALTGAFNWKSDGTAMGDWEMVKIRDNIFVLAMDGDAATNRGVHSAVERLGEFLKSRGARSVGFWSPPGSLGLDDWLAEKALDPYDPYGEDARTLLFSEIKGLVVPGVEFQPPPPPPPPIDDLPPDTEGEECCPPWMLPDIGQLVDPNGGATLTPHADARRLLRQHGPNIMVVTGSNARSKEAEIYGVSPNGLWQGGLPVERWIIKQHDTMYRHILESHYPRWQRNADYPKAALTYLGRTVGEPAHVDKVIRTIPSVAVPDHGAIITEETDQEGRYFGAGTGVLDLEISATLPPRDGSRHMVTLYTKVEFKPRAQHVYVDRLFEFLEDDVAEYLKAAMGRSMWGMPEDMAVFLTGVTRSGKSTLLRAMQCALGSDYYSAANPALFATRTVTQADPNAHTEGLRALFGPRICGVPEAEKYPIDVSTFKANTGGDSGGFRGIRERQVTRSVTAAVWLAVNRMPTLNADPATMERLHVVDYSYTIPANKRDPRIRQAFASREWGPAEAMLALMVKYAALYPPGTTLPVPESVRESTRREGNYSRPDLERFLTETVQPRRNGRLATGDLWERWRDWHAVEGVTPSDEGKIGGQSRTWFSRNCSDAMRKLGWPVGAVEQMKMHGEKVHAWKGIAIVGSEHNSEMDFC